MLNYKPYKTGAVVGKFMPAHRGHKHLIQFACEMCDHVTVVVDCVPNEWPSSHKRAKELAKDLAGLNVKVVALTQVTPQEPGDHPEFWQIWRDLMITACGEKPDALICAMDYGLPLSQVMGSDFVPIDIERDAIHISATMIRKNPWKQWDYILPHARLDYLTRIALEGPESTGKSTIGKWATEQLGFSWIPEWAKCWIEQRAKANQTFEEKDLLTIARAQIASERSLELDSKPVLISDSSLLSTITWSQFLYGRVDPEIVRLFEQEEQRAPRERWLFTPQTPWVTDVHRNFQKDISSDSKRWQFWDQMLKNADDFSLNYKVIDGDFAKKENITLELAKNLKPKPFIWKPQQSYGDDLSLKDTYSNPHKA